MKIFFAQMNDGSTIHRSADKFELVGDAIVVYLHGELVAYMDVGVVLFAHIRDS